ncbi:MAG: hypothetical protein K1X67_15385 [Fimbriimonadaceae bacterium]|nr:hypothetical protein [Fimbriimonadaceae bacterium]
MKRYVPFLALAALIIAGCTKSGSTGATSTEPTKSYVGKWVGNPEVPKGDKADPAAEMASGMMKMMGSIQLEFESESKFKMTMLGMPIEGKVAKEGDTLTLTPETVMGMTKDEAKKSSSSVSMEEKPIKLKLSADGTKLSSIPEKADEPVLVFERGKPEPKHETTMSDSSDLALVGKWGGVIEMPPLGPNATQEEKDEVKMTEQMSKSLELDLRGDGTFKLDMMFEMEGKWKREGAKVTMTPTKMMGMEMTEEDMKKDGNEPMVGEISDGDKTITVLHKDPKKGKLVLRKK